MTDMPRRLPPFVYAETTRHGKAVWYFRRGKGARVRLPAPFTKGFDEAYNAALAGAAKPKAGKAPKGTIGWLIARYMETAEFAAYADITRKNRAAMLKSVAREAGHIKLESLNRAGIQRSIDRRKPFAARNFIKAARPMFEWAVASELLPSDPTIGTRLPKAKTTGFHTWTPDEVLRYEARHPLGTMARLAMDVMLYTGLRREDAIVVGRQHIKDGWLSIRTQKKGVVVERPILAALARSIEAASVSDLTLITNGHGRAFASPAAFGNWFHDRCVEADVPGRAHGLRKAGAVIAAERGATTKQLMAIFGWESANEADRYTRDASRRKLAEEVSKLLSDENGE